MQNPSAVTVAPVSDLQDRPDIQDRKAPGRSVLLWTIAALFLLNCLNYIDRLLFSVAQEMIKVDLGLSDFQLGLIGGPAFALLYTIVSFPIARLADQGRRVTIIAFSLTLWSAMTAFCGMAANFTQMLIGRAAVSIASNIAGFVYAEGDALKLLRAIEAGDFGVVPAFCEGLMDTIRYTSVDLRQEIERGHVDRESEVFKVKMPRFRSVIEKTSELLRQGEAKLRAWRAADDEAAEGEHGY